MHRVSARQLFRWFTTWSIGSRPVTSGLGPSYISQSRSSQSRSSFFHRARHPRALHPSSSSLATIFLFARRTSSSRHAPAAFLPCLGSRRPRRIAIQLCYHHWLLVLARLCYIYRRWRASPHALTILSEHTTSGYFLSPWSTWALGARDKQRPSRLVSYMGYPDPRHPPLWGEENNH